MNDICPICKDKTNRIMGKPKTNSISIKYLNEDYTVVQCSKCNAYYVYPRISFTEIQWESLYNSEYFSIQSNWLIKQRAQELRERFDKAQKYLRDKQGITFLDVGTGEGKTLIEGVKRGWDVLGIDIVDNRIEKAKNEKIKFIRAKFLDCELPENYFDFIYVDSVLEHVLDPVEYLMKIKRILKPKGIIYIGVPNEDSLFNDVRKIIFKLLGRRGISEKIAPFDNPYHVIGFNNNSLNYLIKEIELEILLLKNIGRKCDFLSFPVVNKGFWIGFFFLLPIEMIGSFFKRDVYFQAYLTKLR